jgi:peptidoglycan hydrolase-like protein with peptidoglycan-binding domain
MPASQGRVHIIRAGTSARTEPAGRTQAALRAFQHRQGLTASGQLDAQTLRALDVVDRR